jgi:hypothetical protein
MKELNKASKEIENILLILTIVYILSIFFGKLSKRDKLGYRLSFKRNY